MTLEAVETWTKLEEKKLWETPIKNIFGEK